ncbi:MAG: transglutaminase domain-containing protein, partial [Clostridia bacterium]|nr:transglutaminase domain-containing protein [Clostridia bacterium]
AVNACLERLIAIGYGGPAAALIPVAEGAADRETAIRLAAAVLIVLLAAVFVPCLIGRTHIILPAITGAAILIPVFTYNISRSNWGFAFVIASFAAILVLAAYDRRYLRRHRDCDNDARLFPADPDRPRALPLPAHMAEKARRKAERRQKQAAPTADEEIERYLGTAPAKRAVSAEEKAARRKAEREYRASLRAVRRWRKTPRRARIAAGGFAGVGMLLIAMLILLIPAAYIEGSFTTVEVIDEPMQTIRRYVTAYLMGDNPILDEMGYGGNASNFAPHSTDAQQRFFTGEEIFEVETMYSTNLYLRGWVATDYRDGSWYSADSRGDDETFNTYRATFGTAFSPEVMRTNFYQYVDPSVNTYTDYTKRYQNHTDRGFVTMQVNLRRVGGTSNMVYTPSYFNPKVGIVQYTSSEPSEYTYVNYFDGIYTGRRFLPGAEYGAVTYATTMRDNTFMDKAAVDIAAYNLANDMIQLWYAYTDGTGFALGDSLTVLSENASIAITVEYRETGLSGKLISNDPLYADVQGARTLDLANGIFNRYLNFTKSERADLEYAWRVEDYYRDFAYATYTDGADSDIILREAKRAVDTDLWKKVENSLGERSLDPAAYTARHAAVMAVMDYLSAETDSGKVDENGEPIMIPNFTYTQTPTKQPDPGYDGVENFLAVTHEGYCVQFASAAALMLREMGIPARYVEGYIVTDFRRNLAANSTQRYSASVRDYHAHAWIEVYYDGIGWLNYEATPTYMSDMYEEPEAGVVSSTTRPWYEPDEEEEETEIDPEELARLEAEAAAAEARQRRIVITCVVLGVLLVLAAIITAVSIIVRRARRADDRRNALYAAVRAGLEPGGDRARQAALTLIDEVMARLAACGAAPEVGELRGDYAARLEEGCGPLSPIPLSDLFDAIAAEEFGGGMGDDALRALAVFRAALGDAAKKQLPILRRLCYRYIKHLL